MYSHSHVIRCITVPLIALSVLTGCSKSANSKSKACSETSKLQFIVDNQALDFSHSREIEIRDPEIDGASAIETFTLDRCIEADLNGDSLTEQVAIIALSGAGSGTFYHVAATLQKPDSLFPVPGEFIGDRVDIQDLQIQKTDKAPSSSANIVVSLYTHGKETSMADKPNVFITREFTIRGDHLTEVLASPSKEKH